VIHWASIVAFGLVAAATIGVGLFATRVVRTTPDFFVASRAVGPLLNASAISGEYLSAASFLGVAAMVMRYGHDALWYPAGYAAGYLFLLLFVAAPLRRFGAYTIADFAEGRFDSPALRRVAVGFVLLIGWFYMLPQMKGAGLTVQTIAGGAVPYWVGVVAVGGIISVNVALGGMKGVTFVQAFQYWVKLFAIALPVFLVLAAFGGYGDHYDAAAADGWGQPWAGVEEGQTGEALLFTYSLMAATIFGTAGLPHILVRFYTNRDGHAARQTTLVVLALIGVFYLFPPLIGTIGRARLGDLDPTRTDALLLELGGLFGSGPLAELVRAIAAAGAFAAFMSTTSGLLVTVAGALAHDVYGRTLRPGATALERQRAFRASALAAGAVAVALGLLVERFSINLLVGWAFAIAASSFFPLLVLGIWWRGLTLPGALAGLCLGGVGSSAAIVASMLLGLDAAGLRPTGLATVLLTQPALWSIPLAFGAMAIGSRLTAERVPADVRIKMLRFHAPETLGLRLEYVPE
jgi:cation/acetate symporter